MNIGGLMATLGVDNNLWEAEQDLRHFEKTAQQSLNKVQDRMNILSNKFMNVGKQLSMFVTAPIVAAGGYAFKMASDLTESMNKVDVAFGASSGEVKNWSKTTLDTFGIAQGSALDMTALFGDMGTSMGLTTSEAAVMSKSLVGLAGDIASFKNIGIEQAQTALAGIFTSETESLKRLGYMMQQNNLEQYALAKGITKKMDAMSQAEKVQLRYNFIMDAAKNSQGDFARTSSGAANQMRKFTQGIQEAAASFGLIFMSTITKGITWLNSLLQTIISLDETQKKWIIGILAVAAAIGPLAIIIASISTVIGGMSVAISVATGAFLALKVAMLTNPVGAMIVGLTTVIGLYMMLSTEVKTLTAVQKISNSLSEKATESVVGEQVKIEQLTKTINNLRLPYEMRNKALKDLQAISPKYLGTITEEEVRTGKATLKIKEYISELKNKATAEAAYAGLVDLEKNRLKDIQNGNDLKLTTYEKLTKVGLVYAMGIDFLGQAQTEQYYANLKFIQADKDYNESKLFYNSILDKSTTKTAANTAAMAAAEKVAAAAAITETKKQATLLLAQENQKKVTDAKLAYDKGLIAVTVTQGLFGESLDDGSTKLGIYTTYLNALIGAGITSGKVIENLASRISGLSMTKMPLMGGKGITGKPTVDNTAKNKIVADALYQGKGLKDMTYLLDNADAARAKLMEPTKWQAFGSAVQGISSSFQSLGDAMVSAMQDGSVSFVEGMNIIMQAAIATIGVLQGLAAAGIIANSATLGPIGILTAIAGIATLAALFATYVTPKTQGVGMADGGIIPPGYKNDTFPAMLSSGEAVIPISKLTSLNQPKTTGKVVFEIEGRKLVGILSEMGKLNRSY